MMTSQSKKNQLALLRIERRTNILQEHPDLDFPHSETLLPTYREMETESSNDSNFDHSNNDK